MDIQIQMWLWSCNEKSAALLSSPYWSVQFQPFQDRAEEGSPSIHTQPGCSWWAGSLLLLLQWHHRSMSLELCWKVLLTAAAQSSARAAGKRGGFRRNEAKCVCPPFLFDSISFPNPLMQKDDWIFQTASFSQSRRGTSDLLHSCVQTHPLYAESSSDLLSYEGNKCAHRMKLRTLPSSGPGAGQMYSEGVESL